MSTPIDPAIPPQLAAWGNLAHLRAVQQVMDELATAHHRHLAWRRARRVSTESLIVALGLAGVALVFGPLSWLLGAAGVAGVAGVIALRTDVSRVTGDELAYQLHLARLRLDAALGRER